MTTCDGRGSCMRRTIISKLEKTNKKIDKLLKRLDSIEKRIDWTNVKTDQCITLFEIRLNGRLDILEERLKAIEESVDVETIGERILNCPLPSLKKALEDDHE
jgi:tetrahydromethanopterin S-methyltransferase subunit G